MSEQIRIFEANYMDLLNTNASITITDAVATSNGQDISDFMRNRSLNSAWITTDSTDAALTQVDLLIGDSRPVSDILILGHNLKSFTVSTYNGATYDTQYTTTTETDDVTYITFTEVSTTAIRIVINGTQTADEDKYIKRIIVSKLFGQFNGFPKIQGTTNSTNKKQTRMLSGKISLTEGVGSFGCKLTVDNFFDVADLQLIESIYLKREGVEVWLCGGDEDQFTFAALGYRRLDVFRMRPMDEYKPEWYKGIYSSGTKQTLDLVEVVR